MTASLRKDTAKDKDTIQTELLQYCIKLDAHSQFSSITIV